MFPKVLDFLFYMLYNTIGNISKTDKFVDFE